MTIYLGPLRDRLLRRLGSCSHLRPSRRATSHALRRCGRFGDCCREDCPFHSALACGIGLCCSHPPKRAPIWTVRTHDRPCPRFRVAPCSVQLGLSSAAANDDSDHPLALHDSVVNARRPAVADRGRGEPMPRRRDVATSATVPKGRLELPWAIAHYALNVARLPFRHFGWSRPSDSNR